MLISIIIRRLPIGSEVGKLGSTTGSGHLLPGGRTVVGSQW
jgi:hypothetical protein